MAKALNGGKKWGTSGNGSWGRGGTGVALLLPLLVSDSAAALPEANSPPARPLKMGVVTPLSGTYAGIGQQVRWGLELAAREINAKGGIAGRRIELVFEDEEANPTVAAQKAERLFQVAGVDFLTGTVNSGSTLAVAQVAERNDRLAATTVSFSDAITGDRCSPNMFRVNARASQQSAVLAEWLAKKMPQARVFALGPDYEMGRNTVASFKAAVQQRGVEPVGEIFAPLDSKDYSPYLGRIRATRPNVFYTSVAGNDTVRLVSQLEEYGLLKSLTMIGASGTVTSQNLGAIGKAATGFVTGVGYSPELDTPENKQFVAAFREAFHAAPDLYGADSYGFLYFYKAAVARASSTDTAKLRTAMQGLSWMTPQGQKTMRAGDHQAIQDMYVVQVDDGRFKVVSRVPGEAAIGPDSCSRW